MDFIKPTRLRINRKGPKIMNIKDHFAHWIKTAAEVGKVAAEKYESRIDAILALTDELDIPQTLDLLRIYCELPMPNESGLSNFAQYFQDQDPSFDKRDVPFIFQVLAGISLVQILNSTDSPEADVVSLALSTKTFQWNRKFLSTESITVDLETSAQKYLFEESERTRQPKKATEFTVPDNEITKLDLAVLKAQVTKGVANEISATMAQGLFDAVNQAFETAESKFSSLVESINEALRDSRQALAINTEETNILWWLAGEWSLDLKRPYKELSTTEACLIVGKELAELTKFQPGHNSAKGFLQRILKLTKLQDTDSTRKEATGTVKGTVAIKEAVDSIPGDWNLEWLTVNKVQEILDFCPLHFALLKRKEMGDGEWYKLFERQVGIEPSDSFSFTDLSYQFYQERLLVRAVS